MILGDLLDPAAEERRQEYDLPALADVEEGTEYRHCPRYSFDFFDLFGFFGEQSSTAAPFGRSAKRLNDRALKDRLAPRAGRHEIAPADRPQVQSARLRRSASLRLGKTSLIFLTIEPGASPAPA
jgi:hypothetical protein